MDHGDDGEIKVREHELWQKDPYFSLSYKYFLDLYRINHFDKAKFVLSELLEQCEKIANLTEGFTFAAEYCLQAQGRKMNLLAHRDFYGNHPSWVPNLSLEANYLSFQKEIESSYGILYLTYWLQRENLALDKRLSSIEQGQQLLEDEIDTSAKKQKELIKKLPKLEEKISQVKSDEAFFIERLKEVEKEIMDEARRSVHSRNKLASFKRAFQTLAVFSSAIPGGGPLFGAGVNTVNSMIQGIGEEKPFKQFLSQLPKSVDAFKTKNVQQSIESWNQARERIDFSYFKKLFNRDRAPGMSSREHEAKKREYFRDLAKFASPFHEGLKEWNRLSSKARVPQTEIEQEIAKIKATHPRFKELAHRVKILLSKKKELADQIEEFQA